MVRGLDSFREWFRDYEDQYAIIGGTACDILMADRGVDFRATKDLDLVLIVEAVDVEFATRFWDFVVSAGYEHRNKSTGNPQFYRFTNPKLRDYPMMIELFSRKPDIITLPDDVLLTPIPVDEEISSLSASEVTILDVPFLIPFKAKAWLDLSDRKKAGEQVDSRNIRKHKNDVFRLTELLDESQKPLSTVPKTVRKDMQVFLERMTEEEIDLKQLNIRGKTKETILKQLQAIYVSED